MAGVRSVNGIKLDPPLAYYCQGHTLVEVAAKFAGKIKGCSKASLERRSSREDWPGIRSAYEDILSEKLAERAARAASPEPSPAPSNEGGSDGASGADEGEPKAPRPVLSKGEESLLARTARITIDKLAEQQAEQHLPAFQSLEATWQQSASIAQILSARAAQIAMAHKFETYPSGEVDEVTGQPGFVVRTPDLKPIDVGKLIQAASLARMAQDIAAKAVTGNPAEVLKQAQAALRRSDAEAEFMEHRVAGTLPPEKVEHLSPDSDAFTEFLRTRLGGQERLGVLHGPRPQRPEAEPDPTAGGDDHRPN